MWSLTLAVTPDDVGRLARSKCTPTAPTAPFNVPFPAMFAVAELLKHGADPTAVDKAGKGARELADRTGRRGSRDLIDAAVLNNLQEPEGAGRERRGSVVERRGSVSALPPGFHAGD